MSICHVGREFPRASWDLHLPLSSIKLGKNDRSTTFGSKTLFQGIHSPRPPAPWQKTANVADTLAWCEERRDDQATCPTMPLIRSAEHLIPKQDRPNHRCDSNPSRPYVLAEIKASSSSSPLSPERRIEEAGAHSLHGGGRGKAITTLCIRRIKAIWCFLQIDSQLDTP